MNIAQTDPYYVEQASAAGRLALVRSVGPLSGGTIVSLLAADQTYARLLVEAHGFEVEVENRDLVIRRSRRAEQKGTE